MSNNRNNSIGSLQVSNLHPDVTEKMISEMFSAAGEIISINLIRDRETRRSLGLAYVNFEKRNSAENALKNFNSNIINNQKIEIKWLLPEKNLRNFNVNNIFIKNLDRSIGNKTMYDMFLPFGEIISCKIVRNNQGTSKGFGYIQFKNEISVEKAIAKCNGLAICNRRIIVEKFVPRYKRQVDKEYSERISLKNTNNKKNNLEHNENVTQKYNKLDPFAGREQIFNYCDGSLIDVRNLFVTACCLCKITTKPFEGIVLQECNHIFCLNCIRNYIHINGGAGEVICPKSQNSDCNGFLHQYEINALVKQTICKDEQKLTYENGDNVSNSYETLLELEEESLIVTLEKFECLICFDDIKPLEGVRIRACLHEFCKNCLIQTINNSEDVTTINCPFVKYKCEGLLEQREIQELLSADDYNKYLDNTLKKAELSTENSYHCKTPNCSNWWVIEQDVDVVACVVCKAVNCRLCENIHPGYTCQEYADRILANDDKAQELVSGQVIQQMLLNNNAMKCSTCKAIVQKVDGCDAIICFLCKTELCWATKGPRWGPAGHGDTSGGCRCRVNGVLCTPTCKYCH